MQIEKYYTIHERLLLPARVSVAKRRDPLSLPSETDTDGASNLNPSPPSTSSTT